MPIGHLRIISLTVAALAIVGAATAHAGNTPPPPAGKAGVPAPGKVPKPSEADLSTAISILKGADFLVACEEGNAVKVKKHLAEGANPNAARSSGATALSYAVAGHHKDVVKLLLDAKADPDRASAGLSPLFLASENGDVEIVSLLIKARANVNAPLKAVDEDLKVRNGDTALMAAASADGKPAVVKALLAAGADINARADNGKTAVMQAVASGNLEVLRALLEAKPNVALRMDAPEEIDALTLAVGKSRADMVGLLIAAGADVRVKIDGEVTLLEFAILSEQPQVATMLRKAGVEEPSKARLEQLRKEAAEP